MRYLSFPFSKVFILTHDIQLFGYIVAGHETTSSSLSCKFCFICSAPFASPLPPKIMVTIHILLVFDSRNNRLTLD